MPKSYTDLCEMQKKLKNDTESFLYQRACYDKSPKVAVDQLLQILQEVFEDTAEFLKEDGRDSNGWYNGLAKQIEQIRLKL